MLVKPTKWFFSDGEGDAHGDVIADFDSQIVPFKKQNILKKIVQVKPGDSDDGEGAGNAAFMLDMADDVNPSTSSHLLMFLPWLTM